MMARDTSSSSQECKQDNMMAGGPPLCGTCKQVALEGQCTRCSQLSTCSKCLEQGPNSTLAASIKAKGYPVGYRSKIVEYCNWVKLGSATVADFCTTASKAATYTADHDSRIAVTTSATCLAPALAPASVPAPAPAPSSAAVTDSGAGSVCPSLGLLISLLAAIVLASL